MVIDRPKISLEFPTTISISPFWDSFRASIPANEAVRLSGLILVEFRFDYSYENDYEILWLKISICESDFVQFFDTTYLISVSWSETKTNTGL